MTLDLGTELAGKRLVVFGGTGFLGKVWLALLLERYPEIGHIYLLVRGRKEETAEERFWSSVATSTIFEPLCRKHGHGIVPFLLSKVTPIDGDIVRPLCGLNVEDIGRIDAVVNVSGVVDFSPPLDEALSVNVLGVRHLIDLAKALGNVPLLHTSTCYVAGSRQGRIDELDPRATPFPRANELDRSHWNPEREIAESLELVENARQRANDTFRQSQFEADARRHLEKRSEPARGRVLQEETATVRRRWLKKQLSAVGTERAQFWGWPNIYTYSKSLGEQLVAASGLPFTIVRPAIIESSARAPFPGWNEGINTSAPLIYAAVQGMWHLPCGPRTLLDVIPVDMVASAMILALGALLQGTQQPVYQCGTSDVNGIPLTRITDLTMLHKRGHWRGPQQDVLKAFLMRRYDGWPVTPEQFQITGLPGMAKAASAIASGLKQVPGGKGPSASVGAVAKQLKSFGDVITVFMPFLTSEYVFSCANTRALYARASDADREKLNWTPEKIDWREYWLEIHIPGLEKWVFPEIEAKKPVDPVRWHQ